MVKKAKKRGVKPGTKRGPYKKARKRKSTIRLPSDYSVKPGKTIKTSISIKDWTELNNPPKYSPAPILTLCGQLEDSILLLENRISNTIAKINSLM